MDEKVRIWVDKPTHERVLALAKRERIGTRRAYNLCVEMGYKKAEKYLTKIGEKEHALTTSTK